MPRAIEYIFSQFAVLASHGWSYSCTCSFVEIYNETITDLLDKYVALSRSGVRGRHRLTRRLRTVPGTPHRSSCASQSLASLLPAW